MFFFGHCTPSSEPEPLDCGQYVTEDDLMHMRARLSNLETQAQYLRDDVKSLDNSIDYNDQDIAKIREHIVTWNEAMCMLAGKCPEDKKKPKCPKCPKVVYDPYEYEE